MGLPIQPGTVSLGNYLFYMYRLHDGKPAMMNRAVLALIQASQIQARVRPVAKRSVMRAAR